MITISGINSSISLINEQSRVFNPLGEFILTYIINNVDLNKSYEKKDNELIVFIFYPKNNSCKIQFCFWLKEHRFSFFIEDREVFDDFYIISIICGFFSIITTLLMVWTIGNLDLITIAIVIVIFGLLSAIFLYKFPRIRGIVILMLILIIVGFIYLVCAELFIMPIDFVDIDIFGFLILPTNIIISLILVIPGLLLWYYITVKYFWFEIKRMKNAL